MAAISWKVEGDYFEACNCESTCPCIFLADPSQGDCKLTIAWHIEKGHHGSTRLDGLNVAGIFYAPGNMVTGPKWRAALYIDERASQEQAEALGQIFSGQAGGFLANVAALIGEVMGVRSAPIHFEANGKQRRLHIPTTLELEVEGVTGGDPNREALVVNPALYGAAGFDPVIARSTKYTFKDHGIDWDNSGKNAFYSRFAYEGDNRL
ncbi:MAG: hypothetical protein C4309_14280 [Chloroflexota bacterium]